MTDDQHAEREARITAEYARLDRLRDARATVVQTGLAWWRSGYDDPRAGDAFDAACAALWRADHDPLPP